MRIAIVATHHAVAAGRYMRDAFRRIGVDVRTLGPNMGSNIWGINLAPDLAWHADAEAQGAWRDWRPQLMVLMDCAKYHHLYYHDVPHVVYGVDNHLYNFRQDGIAHYFLAHRRSPEMPAEGADVTWLPCAYDPAFFTPSKIPWNERRYDVAMIGVMTQGRADLIKRLADAGIFVRIGCGPVYREYRDIYHNSKISLCSSVRSDVAQRIFETAAMRCLVLSDPCSDFEDLQPRGLTLYRDADEAIQSIRSLLADSDRAETLIEQSFQWALPHTWDARARFICDWLKRTYRR